MKKGFNVCIEKEILDKFGNEAKLHSLNKSAFVEQVLDNWKLIQRVLHYKTKVSDYLDKLEGKIATDRVDREQERISLLEKAMKAFEELEKNRVARIN